MSPYSFSPGDYLTKNNRFVQALSRMPSTNNGTTTGGIADAVRMGLMGFMMGQDRDQREQMAVNEKADEINAQNTMAQAAKAAQGWVDPDTGQQKVDPGGMGKYAQVLMSNPDTSEVGQRAFIANMQNDAAKAAEADKRAYEQKTWEARQPKYENVQNPFGRGGSGQRNTLTGQVVNYQKPEEQGGPFQGNGMDAQIMNILLQGDPRSQEYKAAYAYHSQPKVSVDPKTGAMTTIVPDMTAFRPPFEGQQPPIMADAPETGGIAGQYPTPGQVPSDMTPPTAGALAAPGQAPTSTMAVPGATVTRTPGEAPPPNQNQANASTFTDRMMAAEDVLSTLDTKGTGFWASLAAQAPGGNYLQSPEYQKYDQARRDFINAQLRQESGAVISPEEFDNANKQYFPQPGDSPEVIEQKRKNRAIAISGMARAAGPGYAPQQAPQATMGQFAPAPAGSGVDFMWSPSKRGN